MKRFLLFSLMVCLFQLSYSQTVLEEGFEGPTPPPEDWTVTYADPNPHTYNLVTYNNQTVYEGLQSFRFSSYMTGEAYDTYLVTKEINIEEAGYALSFWYRNAASDESFRVGFSSTGNDPETDFTWGEEIIATGTVWTELRIEDIPVGTKHVCIHYYSNYKHYLYIDSFKISRPSSMSLISDAVSQTITGTVKAGTENAGIVSVKLQTDGDGNPLVVSQMKFNTTGTTDVNDIQKAKLFFTGGNNTFSDLNMVGSLEGVNGEFEFKDFEATLNQGYNYFWLRYDISEDAITNNEVDAQALEFTIAGEVNTPTDGNPAGAATIMAPLSGEYSIAAENADFTDIGDALSYIMFYGVNGPCTFKVANGTYTERNNIPAIPGASQTNTITFESASGNPDDVILKTDNDSFLNYGFRLEGCAHIQFKNLTFTYLNATHTRLFEITNGANNIKFVNNKFIGKAITGGDTPNDHIMFYSDNSYGHDVEYNLSFIDNTFENGYVGLQMAGIAPTEELEENLIVTGNTFKNQSFNALLLACQNSATVCNNTFIAEETGGEYSAIFANYCFGNLKIDANRIEIKTAGVANAIVLQNSNLSSNQCIVSNNMISMKIDGNEVNGFSASASENINFINNSIYIYGNDGENSSPVNIGTENDFLTLKNNIYCNTTDGPAMIFATTQQNNLVSDHNCIYSPEGTFVKLGNMEVESIDKWQEDTDLDASSKSLAPAFASAVNLHTANTGLKFGKFSSLVPNDFDGDERPESPIMVGADEIEGAPLPTAEYKIFVGEGEDEKEYAITEGVEIDFEKVWDFEARLQVKNTSDQTININLNKVSGAMDIYENNLAIEAGASKMFHISPNYFGTEVEASFILESTDLDINISFSLKGIFDYMGLDETDNTFAIYPNPSNGVINIEANNINTMDIQVLNNQGVCVQSIKNAGNNTKITDLKAGMYMVKISSVEGVQTYKVIVK